MRLSIIVPMLNEIAELPTLLEHLQGWRRQGCEVVMVDGGSNDGSAALAAAMGFTVVESKAGRAKQMNAGAWASYGDVLLFLHADTRLPWLAWRHIQEHLSGKDGWGYFAVRIDGRSRWLRMVSWAINQRSCYCQIATGDQALFVSKSMFNQVNGYPEQPLFEDVELCKRLRRRQKPLCLRDPVITSGRRWEQYGLWSTIFLMWQLRWAYWRGAAVETLAARYNGSAH